MSIGQIPEQVREDDQMRDSNAPGQGKPEPQIGPGFPDVLELASDEVPFTDPTTQTRTLTFTVTSKIAGANQASTAAVTTLDDNITITSVTYTPAGAQAAPTAGNSRAYQVTGSEGTIASFTFSSSSSAFVNGTPINFALGVTSIKEAETLNFQSTTAGTGAVDPGGTLTVVYTF